MAERRAVLVPSPRPTPYQKRVGFTMKSTLCGFDSTTCSFAVLQETLPRSCLLRGRTVCFWRLRGSADEIRLRPSSFLRKCARDFQLPLSSWHFYRIGYYIPLPPFIDHEEMLNAIAASRQKALGARCSARLDGSAGGQPRHRRLSLGPTSAYAYISALDIFQLLASVHPRSKTPARKKGREGRPRKRKTNQTK